VRLLITTPVERGHLQLAGMRAWQSARGNVQLLRHSRRNASSAAKNGSRGNSIATILARDAPLEIAEVQGWVRSVRKQKKIAFAALGDGSTLDSLQAVLKPEQVEQ
jgi:asparaginyl-tRNA synthetase